MALEVFAPQIEQQFARRDPARAETLHERHPEVEREDVECYVLRRGNWVAPPVN